MKVIQQKLVFNGKKLKVRVDRAVEPSGKEVTREFVLHPGAVAIVARLDGGDILLIRQFRYATGRELIEIPAGTLEPGEDPQETAYRELEEETGYRAGQMIERARFFTTPGFTSELMYLYEARDLVKTRANLDEDESIEVETVSVETARQLIKDGRIEDAKTLLGLMMVLGG